MARGKAIPYSGAANEISDALAERLMRYLAECWLAKRGLTGEVTVRKCTPEERAGMPASGGEGVGGAV